MRINKPWYIASQPIRGFEDPPVVQPPVVEPPVVEPPVVEPPAGKTYTEDDIAGLKSALEKERTERKAHEKKVAAFEKAQQAKDDAEKTEVQRLTDQGSRTTDKLQKLAAGFRNNAVEAAIIKAATDAKFTDPTDALRAEVLTQIGVEQDEDDPTQVTVDAASVAKAVKDLAKSKPHYLGQTGGQVKPPSGAKFGGNSNPQQPLSREQELMQLYPALARRV